MSETSGSTPTTFTDFLRKKFKGIINPIAGFLNRLGIHPNAMTIAGLVGTAVGSYFLAIGQISLGGVIVLIAALFDAFDGSMARLRGEPSNFGGFVDSVSDRYAELFIFFGMLVYYLKLGDATGCMLVFMAAGGSVMVSYVKARAEALGFEAKVGLLSRVERYLVLGPCLVFNIPTVAMFILAVFANGTAVQRIWHVRSQSLVERKNQKL